MGFWTVIFTFFFGFTMTASNEPHGRLYPRVVANDTIIGGSCENLTALKRQPENNLGALVLKKCCPIGQHFRDSVVSGRSCGASERNETITANVMFVRLFPDCVQPKLIEKVGKIQVQIVPIDNESIFIDKTYPFYMIQSGALLIWIESDSTYYVYDEYCLEQDEKTNGLLAVIWIREDQSTSYVYGVLLLISALCVGNTVVIYCLVRVLTDIYGHFVLPLMTFLMAYLIAAMAKTFQKDPSPLVAEAIQFSVLMCTFWILFGCFDCCMQVWLYLPKGKTFRILGCQRQFLVPEFIHKIFNSAVYCTLSMLLTASLVSTGAIAKDEHEHPGFNLFMFTQLVVFFVSSCLIMAVHLGWKQLSDTQAISYIIGRRSAYENLTVDSLPQLDDDVITKVKLVFQAIQFSFFVTLVCCLTKVANIFVEIGEALSSLEGVIFMLYFLFIKKHRKMIQIYWLSRVSMSLNEERHGMVAIVNEHR